MWNIPISDWRILYVVVLSKQGSARRDGSVLRFFKLTLNQKDNHDHRTTREYSYPKVPPWKNNQHCLNNIQQQVLDLYNFQDHTCNHDGTLSTQLNCNIRHRNWKEGLRLKICSDFKIITHVWQSFALESSKQSKIFGVGSKKVLQEG